MAWSYRLVLRDDYDYDEPWFEVHEVYYNEQGEPEMVTERSVSLEGENLTDLLEGLEMIRKDITERPPLKWSDFPYGDE